MPFQVHWEHPWPVSLLWCQSCLEMSVCWYLWHTQMTQIHKHTDGTYTQRHAHSASTLAEGVTLHVSETSALVCYWMTLNWISVCFLEGRDVLLLRLYKSQSNSPVNSISTSQRKEGHFTEVTGFIIIEVLPVGSGSMARLSEYREKANDHWEAVLMMFSFLQTWVWWKAHVFGFSGPRLYFSTFLHILTSCFSWQLLDSAHWVYCDI